MTGASIGDEGAGADLPPPPPPPPPPARISARLDPGEFRRDSVETKTSPSSNAFSLRVAKHGSAIEECEDAVAVDPTRGVLAVADGASSSFDAQQWARALVGRFVQGPPKPLSVAAFSRWLDDARRHTAVPDAADDDDPNGWWSEQGVRHGAFATITGVAIGVDGVDRVATIMCLGDSCAFVLTGAIGDRQIRRAIPYDDASQFGSHPSLLRSQSGRPHDDPLWASVPLVTDDLIVATTDAVGEWLLADRTRFTIFDALSVDDLARHLVDERTEGRIVNDDLTVAVLRVESS
ncbi:MAG: hypothetical protein AB8G26_13510 [Ilumatobacter sp.]